MESINNIIDIANTIQLAVAPVFLLAGIAGFLNVLSARLGRIVDRARVIETQIAHPRYDAIRQRLESETATLWRRVRLINRSIWLCATSALTVCLVIIAIFVGEYIGMDIALTVGILFIWAMLLLAVGLITFLAEISISTRHLQQGLSVTMEESESEQPDQAVTEEKVS